MTEVVWAVLQKNDRLLLAQRSLLDHAGGTWNFPGGKVNPEDANDIISVHRELKEEVGLDGRRFRKLFHTHLDRYFVKVFLCDEWYGELKPSDDDIIGVGWFTLAEMHTLGQSLSPFVQEILLYLSYLLQHYEHHKNEWKNPWRKCDGSV